MVKNGQQKTLDLVYRLRKILHLQKMLCKALRAQHGPWGTPTVGANTFPTTGAVELDILGLALHNSRTRKRAKIWQRHQLMLQFDAAKVHP